ncbi:glutamate racemase [Endozoicomonas sp. SM1973]|uniref:Glutamate racemase n=1 Tax=Spartinivicinus marinus TaxID=2994442 RepID=A0A853IB24_9GAMM|nr:glutamate racemase [Spartinivicinus marinus]MCX4027035.1 glutamate racemase [Spartinivicinus marinus]NYZ67031.1 glutamate racemase [Spartinivicinus marinus]
MATALIFDSGVGGLSILQAVSRRLPQLSVVYASDNAAFPYGTKDADWLQQRVVECVSAISQRCTLDIIVIACNTASTIVLPSLRDCFEIPIVGVVPAIKTAAQETKTGCIGLLATPGTVTRHYTNQLIQDFASHCQIIKIGSTELVELAEQKLRGEQICLTKLKAVIQPLILQAETQQTQSLSPQQPDQVVLGCTHFPLLRQELKQVAPDINWVDSGIAIANRVASLLLTDNGAVNYSINSENQQYQATSHTALFTEANQQISRLIPALKQFGIEQIDYLNLPV